MKIELYTRADINMYAIYGIQIKSSKRVTGNHKFKKTTLQKLKNNLRKL